MTKAAMREAQKWMHEAIQYEGDDCLIWPFGKFKDGYGGFYHQGTTRRTSNAIARLVYGDPVPPATLAAHSCRNVACCNKRHISWKTSKENMADKVRDGTDPVGERHPRAKLTKADIIQIRSFDLNSRQLADKFNVTQSAINLIISRKRWQHI